MGERISCPKCGHDLVGLTADRRHDVCRKCGHEFNEYEVSIDESSNRTVTLSDGSVWECVNVGQREGVPNEWVEAEWVRRLWPDEFRTDLLSPVPYLPCPCCGGAAKAYETQAHGHLVECSVCNLITRGYESSFRARDAWNARALPPSREGGDWEKVISDTESYKAMLAKDQYVANFGEQARGIVGPVLLPLGSFEAVARLLRDLQAWGFARFRDGNGVIRLEVTALADGERCRFDHFDHAGHKTRSYELTGDAVLAALSAEEKPQ